MSQLPELNSSWEDEDDLDLMRYWQIGWQARRGIVSLVLAALLLTWVIGKSMTPMFEATATLLVEGKQVSVVSIEEIYGIDPSQQTFLATQIEILTSRFLAERVVDRMSLASHPEFDPNRNPGLFAPHRWLPFLEPPARLSAEQQRRSTISRFQDALQVSPVATTQMVEVSFIATDAELARDVVNTVIEEYIDADLEARLAMTQDAAEWLTSRLERMRTDLERAETDLQAYRERENLIDMGGVQTLTAGEIEQLNQQLLQARGEVALMENQLQAVGDQSQYNPAWERLPGVLDDATSSQLKNKETEAARNLSELAGRYGPKHPRIIAARVNLEEAQQVYEARVRKVVSGFQGRYQQALANENGISRRLNQSKDQIQLINRKQYELSQLEREVETSRQLYDLFFTRFKETDASQFGAAVGRFMDRAITPEQPVRPNVRRMMLVSMFVSLLFGFGLALLRDRLDVTVRNPEEVERKLDQPVLGALPLRPPASKDQRAVHEKFFDETDPVFAESVRTIRTGLLLSAIDSPLRRILVTSTIPGEGKSTLAINLAFALGQLERVILVDADMRKPTLAEHIGIDHRSDGLSSVISGEKKLQECLHQYQGIDVLTAGIVPPNPLELLSSRKFSALLDALAEKYDHVIIDSAPTESVSDSMVLSKLVDGVIYVVRADATATPLIQQGLQRLERPGAHLLGIVLNQYNVRAGNRYGSYNQGYYAYSEKT